LVIKGHTLRNIFISSEGKKMEFLFAEDLKRMYRAEIEEKAKEVGLDN